MARNGRNGFPSLTEGSIRRGIWILAWPAVLTMAIQSANGLIDTYFIGRLNQAAALASVGLANQVGWVIMSLMSSVNVGTTALVARFTGARSEEETHEAVAQSMLLAVLGGLLIFAGMFALMRPLVGLMSDDPMVRRMAVSVLSITIPAVLPFFFFLTITAIFRGLGDTLTPLLIILVTTAINIGGDYALILGNLGFPKMGVVGAATATAASQSTGAVIGTLILLRSPVGYALRGSWRPKLDWMQRILAIGTPAMVQNLLRSLGSWVFFAILARTTHATAAQAALVIGLQLEGLAFRPGFGFNIAAATLVGQNLGARKVDRAERSAWGSVWHGVAVMSAMALVFFVFARPLSVLFAGDDPQVMHLAVLYLRINAISEPFLALSMVLAGAFEGAGDTVPPSIATVIALWIVRLPAAYLLAILLGYGAVGAWAAMSGSAILQGILIAAIFMRGSWKKKQV